MLVVGSQAATLQVPLWEPNDIDIVGSYEEFENFVSKLDYKACYPVTANKFVIKTDGGIYEFELTTTESARQLVEKAEIVRTWGAFKVPSLNWLFALKKSHRYKKNSPHFHKTLRDYHLMKSMGCQVPDEDWLKLRESETYTEATPSLARNKKDFFNPNEGIDYIYDHDSIHEAVSHLSRPAYEYYKPKAEVMTSKKAFYAVDEAIRLYGVVEECYVLALERSQIPYGCQITPYESFCIAISKVCSSITSGWFREYAYENYFKVMRLYTDDYVKWFEAALKRGDIRPYERAG